MPKADPTNTTNRHPASVSCSAPAPVTPPPFPFLPDDERVPSLGATRLLTLSVAVDRSPDAALLAVCAEFHRLNAVLLSVPSDDEHALEQAWDARQRVTDQVASMRPTSDAGRRAKAAVAFSILSETPNWERGSEWAFAMAAFQAEGWA